MNARLRMKLLKPAEPEPVSEPVRHKPLALAPVAWGKPDAALGKMACQSIVNATPPIVLHFNPLTHNRIRGWLKAREIHH